LRLDSSQKVIERQKRQFVLVAANQLTLRSYRRKLTTIIVALKDDTVVNNAVASSLLSSSSLVV
jgi:hypothetical protein